MCAAMALDTRRSTLSQLGHQQERLTEEVSAIKQILVDAGIASPTRFAAQIHRHRFKKLLVSSGWKPSANLIDVLSSADMSACLLNFIGEHDRRNVRSVCDEFMVATSHACVYVTGGFGDGGTILKSVHCFRSCTSSWEELPPMLVNRACHVSGVIAGRIYVCGGIGQFNATAERYCPWTRQWWLVKSMHARRGGHGGAIWRGKLYATGGSQEPNDCDGLSSAEVFDPSTSNSGTWEILPPMFGTRTLHAAAACAGHIFVLGGVQDPLQCQHPLNTLESFSPAVGCWSQLPPMPTARYALTLSAVAGHLYACGGACPEMVLKSMDCFDISKTTWHSLNSLLVPRKSHSTTVCAGQIHVMGGVCALGLMSTADFPDDQHLCDMVSFNVKVGLWQAAKSMPIRRAAASAVSICG